LRTAVISDLHLGSRRRDDVLREPAVRAALLRAAAGADQIVLLGDSVELRDRPLREALAVAEPFFAALGTALGGGRLVIVPGNHDHRLVHEAAQLRRRPSRRTELHETIDPGAGGALGRIRSLVGTEVLVAYPGVWLGNGVWATHGHYLDAHSATPTVECVAAAAVAFARRRSPLRAVSPADYEAILSPTYRLYFEIAQRRRLERLADVGKAVVRALERGVGVREAADQKRRPPTFGKGRLGAVEGELRRPGVLPLGAVLERLGVEADHVLFGHTHRTGPLPGDVEALWRTPSGARLWNTGSWVYERGVCVPAGPAGPYWPGTVTLIEGGRPRFVRALDDRHDLGRAGGGDGPATPLAAR
jgi:predicted phosphodiesterase